MAKTFRISFDIPEHKLATVVSLLSSEVANLVIRDTATITNGSVVPQKRSYTRAVAGGKTAVGYVYAVLAQIKVGTEVPYTKVIDTLVKNGYTAATHTSIISKMVADGLVKRHAHNTFIILKAFPNA